MDDAAGKELLSAASDGDLAKVEAALAKGADVSARTEYGDTALNFAAENGHTDVVLKLLDNGADIHNVGGADKTPIMNAAFAGNVGIVRLLLERGAVVNDDLLSSMQMKVNILAENAEEGMVRPDAVEAWQQFLEFLISQRAQS